MRISKSEFETVNSKKKVLKREFPKLNFVK